MLLTSFVGLIEFGTDNKPGDSAFVNSMLSESPQGRC